MSITGQISVLFVLALLISGCTTTEPPNPPTLAADTIITTAVTTHATGLDVFAKFGAFIDDVEGFLEDQPKVRDLGEQIKANGETWLNQLDLLMSNFKDNRTDENRVRLLEIIAVVQSAISGAQSVPGALSKPKPK